MKLHAILLSLLVASMGVVNGDEHKKSGKAGEPKRVFKTQYMLTLAEYELEEAIPLGLSEAEVLELIRKSKASPVGTIRMSAVEDTESMVQFGRRVAITTGQVSIGRGTSRRTEFMETGTIVSVRIAPHAKGAIADVDFSASRLDGDGSDDTPPEVVTTTAQATQIYAMGKERLLASTSLGDKTCIVITVREIP